MHNTKDIYNFLLRAHWSPGLEHCPLGEQCVSFLAAGEYNANYRVSPKGVGAPPEYVFRVNHGSQLGIDRQIDYEFKVLKALSGSGVTPIPFFRESDTGGLGNGVMLMEFVSGRPLDYTSDLDTAALIFSRVHSQQPTDGLIRQPDPVADIAAECLGLLERYPDHPLKEARAKLTAYHGEVMEMAERTRRLFAQEAQVVVNTEVNSHNFLLPREEERGRPGVRPCLVDWEKAVVSSRYQDLGHFMVATTTRWKSGHTLSEEQKYRFLKRYKDYCGLDADLEHMRFMSGVMERTIVLRGLSWSYMAYHEYREGLKTLTNPDTRRVIEGYLDNLDWYLASVPDLTG